ncbi:Tetracycline repressor protein class H [Rubripirellula lacrimiformis]|uniref:Tetracycline repressor protein class H n=1 Tax=Rubripirellula lacrimiformis TaxID=1930273 RepID=A0A517NCM2_9BACT|nr:TetR/AcrR family transcriptional regulator C-terminal domain-containing protein [Rubripirellula lacrimiformis]QDT04895.1 Tetracycline repressor protein class H [Rubripirellula lacrimiformis]
MAKTKKTDQRRGSLRKERVLEAAVRIADQGGIDALTMRKIAQKLNVEAMSLYNHVANKDEILDGIVDAVVGEIDVPAVGGDWRVAMQRRATSAHQVLMQHPWATMLIVSRVNSGPAMLRYADATIGCLVEAGFSYPAADYAWNAIDSFVYGFTLQKLNFPFQPDQYATVATQYLPMIPADEYPYLHSLSQQVIALRHDGIHELDFGLELVLDGLEAMRRR